MNPVYLAPILAIIGLVIQLANLILFLRLRVAMLESEKRVLDEVACKYPPTGACNIRMEEVDRRLTKLEERSV